MDTLYARAQALINDADLDIYGSKATLAKRREKAQESDDTTSKAKWRPETTDYFGYVVNNATRPRHVRDTGQVRQFVLWKSRASVHDEALDALDGPPDCVYDLMVDVKFNSAPSSLFIYSIKLRTWSYNSRTYYFAHSYTREARVFMRHVFANMLMDVFYLSPPQVAAFNAMAPAQVLTLSDMESFVKQNIAPDDQAALRSNLDTKCFFLSPQIRLLETSFRGQQRAIELLKWTSILSLEWRLRNEPYRLCFRRTLPKPVNVGFENEQLEPLLLEDARAASEWAALAPNPMMELAVKGFETLVSALEEQKHGYLEESEVLTAMSGHAHEIMKKAKASDVTALIERAKRFLMDDMRIVALIDQPPDAPANLAKRWQLKWVNEAEQAVVESLSILAQRNTTSTSVSDAMGELTRSDGACSEQIRAWNALKRYPFLLIDGQGGSGKSEFIRKLCARLPKDWYYCTAATSAACANLSGGVQHRAQNFHKLLHCHATECIDPATGLHVVVSDEDAMSQPPLKEDATALERFDYELNRLPLRMSSIRLAFKRCIAEQWRVFVIDEFGLVHPSVLGPLLLMLVACAPWLEKLLMVGDNRQMPPIGWGHLSRELSTAFGSTCYRMSFWHNHRAGADDLVHNNKMTHAMRPEELRFGKQALHVPLNLGNYAFEDKLSGVISVVKTLLARYKPSEYESLFVTRTNEYRHAICQAVTAHYLGLEKRRVETGGDRTLYTGRKYVFERNQFDLGVVAKKLYVLEGIEDVLFDSTATITGSSEYLKTSPLYPMQYVREQLPQNPQPAGTGRNVDVVYQTSTKERLEDGRVRFLVMRDLTEYARRNSAAKGVVFSENIEYPTFVRVPADPKLMSTVVNASCVTVYGAQSGQIPKLFYVLPYYSQYETTPCVYTAGSRTQQQAYYVCDRRDLNRAILNPEPTRRASMVHALRALVLKLDERAYEYEAPEDDLSDDDDDDDEVQPVAKKLKLDACVTEEF